MGKERKERKKRTSTEDGFQRAKIGWSKKGRSG